MTQPAPLLQAESLRGLFPGLVHGFSPALPTAGAGVAGQATQGFKQAAQQWLAQNLPLPDGPPPLMVLDQIHSATVAPWPPGPPPPPPQADGVLAMWPGKTAAISGLAAIRTADCMPILAADPETGSFAALHAGWRGIAQNILPNLLAQWRLAGSSLSRVRLALGPSIHPCCFQVREDCLSQFAPRLLEGAVLIRGEAAHLDLELVVARQAGEAGLQAGQIESVSYCTCCFQGAPEGPPSHPYASYRRAQAHNQPLAHYNLSFIGVAAQA